MLLAEPRPVVHVAVQAPVLLIILETFSSLRSGLQYLLAERATIPVLLGVDLEFLRSACVWKDGDSLRSRLGGVERVTGRRRALTSVAALLHRPITFEGENLELILRTEGKSVQSSGESRGAGEGTFGAKYAHLLVTRRGATESHGLLLLFYLGHPTGRTRRVVVGGVIVRSLPYVATAELPFLLEPTGSERGCGREGDVSA